MRIAAGLLLGVAVAALARPAAAALELTYQQPERYTDANLRGGYGEKARTPALDGLRKHLEALAARYLRPELTLSITVTDLDLAGHFEPWRANAYDVRFLREVTPPRIKLAYVLRQGDTVLSQAEETVSDLNYLARPDARRRDDPLRYEKALLEDWFKRKFS